MPETSDPPASPSVPSTYANAGGPTSSLMRMLLSSVPDQPGVELDERTVARFCAHIEQSARALGTYPLLSDPGDRAQAFHYLLTLVGWAIDSAVLHADPLQPMFTAPRATVRTDWGAGNPDGVYRRALLAPDHSYRISGRLGNADYLAVDVRFADRTVTLTRDDLEVDDDARFELFLGGPERATSWVPLDQGVVWVLTREFFHDWMAAERSQLRIECLSADVVPPTEHSSRRVAAEWDVIGEWIEAGGVRYWAEHAENLMAQAPNDFLPTATRTGGKLPPIYQGAWRLAPDEALVVEFDDPAASYWGFQLATTLRETLEFANRITSVNPAQIAPDDDGRYRLVISRRDPGIVNWLDTDGLTCGEMILRVFGATRTPNPRARTVALSEVGAALPGALRCTAEQRRAQIERRREGVARMVCD